MICVAKFVVIHHIILDLKFRIGASSIVLKLRHPQFERASGQFTVVDRPVRCPSALKQSFGFDELS